MQTLLADISSRLATILHVGKHGYYLHLNISTDQFARQLSGTRKLMDSKETGMTVQSTENFRWIEHLPLVSIVILLIGLKLTMHIRRETVQNDRLLLRT